VTRTYLDACQTFHLEDAEVAYEGAIMWYVNLFSSTAGILMLEVCFRGGVMDKE
jgi:hypothetical protein